MRSNDSKSRRARTCLFVLAAAVALVTSACGPRWSPSLDQQAQVAAGQVQTLPGGTEGTTTLPGGAAAAPSGEAPAGTDSAAPGQPGVAAPGAPAAGGGQPAPTDPGPRPGVTKDTIRICYLVPLTGAAPVPTSWKDGAELYWKYLKQKGGIHGRNIDLETKDTTSDTATALARARDCINDKRFTFVTLDRFEVEAAVGQFLNSKGIPNMLVQAPPRASGPDQKNTFVTTIDHVTQGRLIADYFMSGDLKGKRYAVVRENVQDLVPGVNAFKEELKRKGGQFVREETIEGKQNDFSSTVLALSNAKADAVWVYAAPEPMIKLAQQSQAAQYHPVWFANSISWAFDDAAQVGNANGALDGARAFSSWVSVSSPAANHYKAAYREIVGGEPDDIGLVGWGVGEVLAAALDRAGKDLGYNTFRASFQSLNFTPEVWAPQSFGPGARFGTRSVIEFRISGDHWNQVGTFRSSF